MKILSMMLGAWLALAASNTLANTPAADPAAAHAQRLLDALREVSGVPGLGAAVWQDGQLRWQGQSGLRDLARQLPVQADTRFRLASVSKLFAATAAAQLHERGQLDVDAPLPWHPFPAGHPGAAITPRQLAAHVSGLPHYELSDSLRGDQAFADSRSAARRWLAGRSLHSAPGTSYRYSSWGYTLLGAAVEAASGQSLQQHLATQLTAGLDILPDPTDQGDPRTARPYEGSAGRWRLAAPHDFSYSLGGAGLAATPGALASWGGQLLQGRYLKPATLAWMTRPTQFADGRPVLHEGEPVAFGWRVGQDAQQQPVWHHAGSTQGARSALLLRPGSKPTSAALLSNATWVASIVDSALTLTEVFMPPAAGGSPRVAPQPGDGLRLHWGSEVVNGRVSQRTADATLHLQLAREPKGMGTRTLRLLPLREGGDLAQAALVTPVGLYLLQADAQGELHRYMGSGGGPASASGRDWRLVFERR